MQFSLARITGLLSAVVQTVEGIKSIKADDGREVVITYEKLLVPEQPLDSPLHKKVVKQVKANGWPKQRVVNYKHNWYSGYSVDHGEGIEYHYGIYPNGTLYSVTYPEGGKINYQYAKLTSKRLLREFSYDRNDIPYQPLTRRTVSDESGNAISGTWEFEQKDLQSQNDSFSRIIHTPSNTIEFWYRKAGYEFRHMDTGRLKTVKVYNKINSTWNEYAQPYLSSAYTYTDIFKTCGSMFVNTGDTQRNIRKLKESHRLYSGQNNSTNIEFQSKYNWILGGVCDSHYQLLRRVDYSSEGYVIQFYSQRD